jgi:hypothetical protein
MSSAGFSGFSSAAPTPPHGRYPRFKAGQRVRCVKIPMSVTCVWWEEGKCTGYFSYNLAGDGGKQCSNIPESMIEPDGGEIIWDEERL